MENVSEFISNSQTYNPVGLGMEAEHETKFTKKQNPEANPVLWARDPVFS
jgi:hypothetical protein